MHAPQRIEVPEGRTGERLDRFLGEHLGSRAAAQRAIESGLVTVDGEPRPKRWTVSPGEVIEVGSPEAVGPLEDTGSVEVPEVFADRWLVVADKPAGMVSHPAPGHPVGTLSQSLATRHPGAEVGLVHRLDRETSGLLIAALDAETLRDLRALLQARLIERQYLALVMGQPKTAQGTIDAPIGRDTRERTKISTRTGTPRSAVTHFETIEAFEAATLLRVTLETGRTHQIRVHLAAIGLPVAGDPTYGREGAWGLGRQFLHAGSLRFDHPRTGERLELSSPLPADLAGALERARSGQRP